MKQCLTKVSQHYKDVIEEEKELKMRLRPNITSRKQLQKIHQLLLQFTEKLVQKKRQQKRKNKISQFTSNPNEQAQLFNEFSDQPFSIVDKSWNGPNLPFEITFLGGKDIIEYNTNHVFFEIFKECRDEIRDGINTEYNATRLLALLDILMISFAKTEARLDPEMQLSTEDFIENFKNQWGTFLRQYSRTYKSRHGE